MELSWDLIEMSLSNEINHCPSLGLYLKGVRSSVLSFSLFNLDRHEPVVPLVEGPEVGEA